MTGQLLDEDCFTEIRRIYVVFDQHFVHFIIDIILVHLNGIVQVS